MSKQRLDLAMVERGLAESRAIAQRLVMAGQVRVEGEVELKPGASVSEAVQIEIEHSPPFVSRGGEKLQAALQAFSLHVSGLICADVGASTGGFTDCLLQHGAQRVYAIDVGKGILHWKLRQDPRVVVMEGVNARHLEVLPEPVSLVTVDVSFISLKIILPVIRNWFDRSPAGLPGSQGINQPGQAVVLIKPQFEAGRTEASRGQGVIRDPQIHQQIIKDVLSYAESQDYQVSGLIRSPLLGPKGNVEFLAWLISSPTHPASYPSNALNSLIDVLFDPEANTKSSQVNAWPE